MIGENKIRAAILAGPLEALRLKGNNIDDMLLDFKLSSRVLANPETPIEIGIYLDILDRCNKVSRDKLFSLSTGLNQDFLPLGLLGRTI